MFDGEILLITGGTGSFGHAVLDRFLKTNVKEVRIFSRDEKKQEDMRIQYSNSKLKFYIGDVRNIDSLRPATKNVDYIFHAAALKQVPSCEFYPMEAVQTNVIGTENVMNAAIESCVKRMVLLSTDKAVYPINSMGISKAMAEKLLIAKSRSLSSSESNTIFCATRYGNVMGSRGSVIPLIYRQIKSGKPITLTDPKMTRFLMTLEESVDLVLHAFIHGAQGDIFVRKAPATTLKILASAIAEHLEYRNPEVKIIGTRHGEKLYETLISREEMARVEDMGTYYRIPADNRDLNYSLYFTEGESKISQLSDYTSHNTTIFDAANVKILLNKLNQDGE